MSNFKHSIVLFSGDDGLPLEFNIINSTEKELLKALIEHGGGLCTLGDDAIHLVSPGTRVFNVDFKKKFLSSNFVLDCVEKNYQLKMSDYEIKITALETSDISDDSENIIKPSDNIKCVPVADKSINTFEIDIGEESPKNSKSKIVCSNVCSDDFVTSKLEMFSSTPSVPIQENSPRKVVEMDLIMEEPSLEQVIEEYTSLSETANDTKREVIDMDIDIDNPSSSNNLIEDYSSSSKLDNIDKVQAQTKEADFNCSNLGEGEISDRTPSDLQVEMQVDDSKLHRSEENFREKTEHVGEGEISDRTPSDLQIDGMQINVSESHISKKSLDENGGKLREDEVSHRIPDLRVEAVEVDESESHISKGNICSKDEHLEKCYKSGTPDLQAEGVKINESGSHVANENFSGNDEYFVEKSHVYPQDPKLFPDQLQRVEKNTFQLNTNAKKCPEPEVAVSSSQPEDDVDYMTFKMSQKLQVNEEEEGSSQSFTVSSSADAQVSSKADVSGEIFENNFPSESGGDNQDGQFTERQLYIQKLEKEVEKVLQKPSPKSIQDKLILVKYICCVKRLPPAEVLQSLANI